MGVLWAFRARASRGLVLGGVLVVALAQSSQAQSAQAQSPPGKALPSKSQTTPDKDPLSQLTPPAPGAKQDDINQKALLGTDTRVAPTGKPVGPADQPLLDKFQRLLSGAKMTGMFTVDGRPLDKLSAEQYEIQKVEKQAEGDWWLITARVKYGEKDFSIPVPVEVKWAGTTPVITLDKVTLPGYGTFSARVVFHGDRYAGTWQHDDKGGHLFGKVEIAPAAPAGR